MATKKQKNSALEQLTELGATDLRKRAERGELPRAYGRDREVHELLTALSERRSVLLLGPSGVGKSAVLYEAIYRMVRKEAPEGLWGKTVVQMSCTMLEQGARNTGEWAARLGEVVSAIKAGKDIYLYLDDIWTLREAGRYSGYRQSFATYLQPLVESKQLLLLGESTPENYTRTGMDASHWDRGLALADDHSLMAHVAVITVAEPTPAETRSIVRTVVEGMERRHRMTVEPAAVERALELTRRFLIDQAFPGKAIRLLEEVQRRMAREAADKPVITHDRVMAAFSELTGLPQKVFSDEVPLVPDEIRAWFTERVVGQADAVEAMVDRVTLIKAELHEPDRPLGVLLFVGPTGTGKTHMAKMLAEYLFGSEDRLARFDMSEYKHYNSVPDLMRALVARLTQEHFSVLLLDEVEKAAPYVFDLFLQAFGDGRLTDPASGRSLALRNTLVIMTSNLGGGVKGRTMGFARGGQRDEAERQRLLREVEEYFRPEFINRLDNIVVFRPLDRDDMRQIARRELGRALQREGVTRRNILLDFQEDVLDVLLAAGFSETYGARPLKRAIDRLILLPLARQIAAKPGLRERLLEFQAPEGKIEIATISLGPARPATRPEASVTDFEEEWEEEVPPSLPALSLRQIESGLQSLRRGLTDHVESDRFKTLVSLKDALLEEMLQPSFWDDQEHAHEVNRTIYHLDRITNRLLGVQRRAESLTIPEGLARRDSVRIARISTRYRSLESEAALAELELLATDAAHVSATGARIRIVAMPSDGAPGAVSWPLVLLGMYQGWAERHGYEAETEVGSEALITLRGGNLAGILAGEAGIHRRRTLIQKWEARRTEIEQALVEVSPLAPDGEPAEDAGTKNTDLVRLYSFGRSHYVRDPRTGERSHRAREVLHGEIDDFLLAYLSQELPSRRHTG